VLHRLANCKNRLFGGTTRIATEKRQTKPGRKYGLSPFLAKQIRYDSHRSLSHLSPSVSYKRVCKDSINLRGRKLRARPSYISVLFDDTFLKFYTSFADNVSQQKCAMSVEGQMRVAYYLRVSTESQELDNQRTEILPFINRRGWKLVHAFEDVMSGQKGETDRLGFAAMLKAAHQRKFDILVFWALDRLTREGTRATLNYLQRLESKGVGYVSYQEQWLDSTGPFKDVTSSRHSQSRNAQEYPNELLLGLRWREPKAECSADRRFLKRPSRRCFC
jgi:predicted site-specific integrase-resolvase